MSYAHPRRRRALLRLFMAVLVGAAVVAPAASALAAGSAVAPVHHARPAERAIVPAPPTWPLHPQALHAPKSGTPAAVGGQDGTPWTDLALVAGGVLLVAAAACAVMARTRIRLRRSRLVA